MCQVCDAVDQAAKLVADAIYERLKETDNLEESEAQSACMSMAPEIMARAYAILSGRLEQDEQMTDLDEAIRNGEGGETEIVERASELLAKKMGGSDTVH